MARTTLNWRTLGEIAGGASGKIIDRAIDEALGDVDDRGEDGKPRKVVIELTVLRRPDGQVESLVAAAPKLPPRQTAQTTALLRRTGNQTQMVFQSDSPEDPSQSTIDEHLGDNRYGDH